jgi:hypothetical protein
MNDKENKQRYARDLFFFFMEIMVKQIKRISPTDNMGDQSPKADV